MNRPDPKAGKPAISPAAAGKDPWAWQALLVALFALAVFWRLDLPSKPYFDEVHYVPAARAMLAGHGANPEHPLVAKGLIALSIAALGDFPLAWRLPGALLGVAGLWGFGRAIWWASGRRFAAMAGVVLLASNFLWFVQSRIAMLDMAMAGLIMLGLWQAASVASGRRGPVGRRLALAGCGLAFGLAMGAKWSGLPIWLLVAGGLIWQGWQQARAEAGERLVWLLVWPVLVYWLSFLPSFFYTTGAVDPLDLLGWHRQMLALQSSVVTHHPYQSVWSQWIINQRPIWYLYEVTDGAQRGVLLLGNPVTMLAGLLALGWCAWRGWFAWRGWLAWRGDDAAREAWLLWLPLLYGGALGLWVVGRKPVQFYYHYQLPAALLCAGLALALDRLWRAGPRGRHEAVGVLIIAAGLFGWFWPILSGAPLGDGPASFLRWMWLDSWR